MSDEPTYQERILEQHEELARHLKRHSFWQLNIGHVGTISLTLALWVWYISKFDSRVQLLEAKVFDQQAQVLKMDEHGTQASQKGIYQESEFSKSTERRVAELERQWREAGPKLERIDVNMQYLRTRDGTKP